MKILCLERDNTTFQSSQDTEDNSYRASFELYPFHEGKDHAVFKGMMNGLGRKRGRLCAVKARVTHPSNQHEWLSLVECSLAGRRMASTFNEVMKNCTIRFTQPLIAQMNKVSDFNGVMRLFQPHEKKLMPLEYVILEDFIEGKFERFNSSIGAFEYSPETEIIQAFSHFSWHQSREFVICGLQGVRNNGVYEITSPTIHSISGRFGRNDCGVAGIAEVFSQHHCNNICRHWDIPLKLPLHHAQPVGSHTYPFHYLPPTAPPAYNTH